MWKFRFQVKEHHLDTFRHVNNATYLDLYEEARWEVATLGGYGLEKVLKTQQGPVILEVDLKFKRELKNRQWITIETKSLEIGPKISRIHQSMISEEGEVCSEALFIWAFFDLKNRKIIPPSEDWLSAFRQK